MDEAGAGERRAGEHHNDIKCTRLQALRPPWAPGFSTEGSHHGRLAAAQPT